MVGICDLAILRHQDLINNPSQRVPMCFCLDVSESMKGELIDGLYKGIARLFEGMNNDDIVKYAVETAIITFGDKVECIRDFTTVALNPNLSEFCAEGRPLMGEAVNLAIEKINEREAEYRKNGVDFYKPWLVLVSGSHPEQTHELKKAKETVKQMIKEKKLQVYSVGIGENADMNELGDFSQSSLPVQKFRAADFEACFKWISKSISNGSVRITE